MTIHVSRNTLVVVALVAAGAGVLALTFGVPLGNLLWIGLVLACPLMMVLMMGGHGGDGHGGRPGHGSDQYPGGVQ